jgi:hypothetical protein
MDSLNDSDISLVKTYNHNDKKLLLNRISELKNKKCNKKIFALIDKNNIEYTENSNGFFLNLSYLTDEILTKIEHLIDFYENKQKKQSYSKIDCNYTESSDLKDNSNIISIERNKNINLNI